jgi:hypothetical protein
LLLYSIRCCIHIFRFCTFVSLIDAISYFVVLLRGRFFIGIKNEQYILLFSVKKRGAPQILLGCKFEGKIYVQVRAFKASTSSFAKSERVED